MLIKDFLDGNIGSSFVFNLEEISLHKEGPNATIILLFSLSVVWFSLLDVGNYNFAVYIGYIACQSFGSVCWTLEAIF